MRKYIRIIVGLLILLKELFFNFGRLKIHGIKYHIDSGVTILTHSGGKCDLGRETWLSADSRISVKGGKITLGNNNYFNTNCRIISMSSISIGNNNLFGPNVIIVDNNHNYSDPTKIISEQGFTSKPIKIGSEVWVGGNSTICSGVEICDHVVIGANSVITKSISEPGVYAGCPVRKIKEIYQSD